MHRWFRVFMERLAFRLMSVLSAKIETQFDLELSELRMGLLQRAAEIQHQSPANLATISEALIESSTRLGQSGAETANEIDCLEHDEPTQPVKRPKLAAPVAKKSATGTTKRGRGRPPKTAEGRPANLASDKLSATKAPSDKCTDGH